MVKIEELSPSVDELSPQGAAQNPLADTILEGAQASETQGDRSIQAWNEAVSKIPTQVADGLRRWFTPRITEIFLENEGKRWQLTLDITDAQVKIWMATDYEWSKINFHTAKQLTDWSWEEKRLNGSSSGSGAAHYQCADRHEDDPLFKVLQGGVPCGAFVPRSPADWDADHPDLDAGAADEPEAAFNMIPLLLACLVIGGGLLLWRRRGK